MADAQSSSSPANQDDIAHWMAQRWRDVQSLGGQAETAGRNLWAQATRAGQNLAAPNPSDIAALGARFLNGGNSSAGSPATQLTDPQFAPSPDAPTPTALRQQQAHFKQTQLDPLDRQNSWMAEIALAPTALLDAPAALGLADSAEPAVALTDFPELDAWLAQIEQKIARPLSTAEKNALRDIGRARWAQAYGTWARDLSAQVHHEFPLEWSHLIDADPNRLSNLVGLEEEGHQIANQAWALFKRSLRNAPPTPAQVMAQKLRVNPTLEPFVLRPGLPRPPPTPPIGGAP
jgi:hypothetical protein